jgi:2-polyprenyl-3-methyl-5-hydroxy-6-metoxy-1,4-benzoquinol methylase
MSLTPAGTSAHYDEAFYQNYRGWLNQYWWARRFYAALIKRYRRGGRLLEVGCGVGDVLRRLEGFDAYGIDVSEYAVARASERAPQATVSVGTAESVAELPGPFNVLASFHVVEHLEDPGAVLKLWGTVVRSGGLLVIATPNPDAPLAKRKGPKWHGNHPTHIALKTPAEWKRLTEEAGFTVRKMFGDGLWDVPYVPVVPKALQLPIVGFPAAVQAVTTLPFIPVRFGESLILVAERE